MRKAVLVNNCSENGWLPRMSVWDPQAGEAAWRIGVLDNVLDVITNSATRAARRAPQSTSSEHIFWRLHRSTERTSPATRVFTVSTAHQKITTWFASGRMGEVSASLTTDGRRRLHIQQEWYTSYLDEELGLQQRRRKMHRSRPWRLWSSGEWCWFWRPRAHSHRRTTESRHFMEGTILGPASSTARRRGHTCRQQTRSSSLDSAW